MYFLEYCCEIKLKNPQKKVFSVSTTSEKYNHVFIFNLIFQYTTWISCYFHQLVNEVLMYFQFCLFIVVVKVSKYTLKPFVMFRTFHQASLHFVSYFSSKVLVNVSFQKHTHVLIYYPVQRLVSSVIKHVSCCPINAIILLNPYFFWIHLFASFIFCIPSPEEMSFDT